MSMSCHSSPTPQFDCKSLENKLLSEADHSQSSLIFGYTTKLKNSKASLAKTSKNKQIGLKELQSIYRRMMLTRVCQQR